MKSTHQNPGWLAEKKEDIGEISSILKTLGYTLDEDQPHLSGERYLMTREKLVLTGTQTKDGERVIIKVSNHPEGQKEIQDEKKSRDLLKSLSFAKKDITFPDELYYHEHSGYLFWITSYISQEKIFVAHTIEEQFFLILRSFEAQEAFHATTFEHLHNVRATFPVFRASEYLREFEHYIKAITENYRDSDLSKNLERAEKFLKENEATVDRYTNHLTHTDFVPHNFRIKGHDVYMLDCSSVYFGNKYEAWARFLNYMTVHNPTLEQLLSEYIRKNRGEDEYLSLRLMRVFKIGKLLEYYSQALQRTEGDLHKLTKVRIMFWNKALEAILEDKQLNESTRNEYISNRDKLRSPEEKERQKEFAVA